MDRGHLEVESPHSRLQAKYGILLPGTGATVAMEACLVAIQHLSQQNGAEQVTLATGERILDGTTACTSRKSSIYAKRVSSKSLA